MVKYRLLQLTTLNSQVKRDYYSNWLFTVSNNFNVNRKYVIPIFIDEDGRFNRRISEYLIKIDELDIVDENTNYDVNVDLLNDTAHKSANEISENVFGN